MLGFRSINTNPSSSKEDASGMGEDSIRAGKRNVQNGICRPSSSQWASDVVLVRKKDGTLRFAIDYRKLNAITKKDTYGLPNPLTILDKLDGSKYFTFLDFASAYWCVPMRETGIEKTAFHTPRGKFEMLVMPFGMINSGATFQRLMDQTLGQVDRYESYIDDILIYSKTFEEHTQDLRQTFQALEKAGIQLKEPKGHIGYSEGEFLGHHISSRGRKPIQSYAEKLKNFPRPDTVSELQRF